MCAVVTSPYKLFSDLWHSLVREAMCRVLGNGENDEFWTFCHTQLSAAASYHAEEEKKAVGLATRMRHLDIVRNAELLSHPDGDMSDILVRTAEATLGQARRTSGQARQFALAEMRLCLVLGDIDLERIGTAADEIRFLEESCTVPV